MRKPKRYMNSEDKSKIPNISNNSNSLLTKLWATFICLKETLTTLTSFLVAHISTTAKRS